VADPEDDGVDVVAFADFMRSTKAPPRGSITTAVQAGEAPFNKVGCAVCHTPSITTARPGARINGAFSRFHPPSATRSSILIAIFCCTTSGRAMAYRFCLCPNTLRPPIRCAPLRCGAANPQSADARRFVVHQTRRHSAPCRTGRRRDPELQRPV
jgi:hypothetical protein